MKVGEPTVLKFLDILASAPRDNFISGQLLARKTGTSRTAVWKNIRKLRHYGYGIESIRGSGYLLVHPTQLPVPWELRKILRTSLIGREIIFKELVDSTQNIALSIAAKRPEADGVVVIAGQQKSGRGRMSRTWISPPGGLWFSVLVRPGITAGDITIMPFVAALAVRDAVVRLTNTEAKLKWPNDVLVSGKKVAGILLDVSAEADKLNYAVFGIGVNVNTDSSELRSKVQGGMQITSLKDEVGHEVSRLHLAAEILEGLESRLNLFLREGPRPLIAAWKERTDMIGKKVSVIQGSGILQEGTATDIDEDGSLVLELKTGRLSRVVSGDVRIRL